MKFRFHTFARWLVLTGCVAAAAIAVVFHSHWLPAALRFAEPSAGTQAAECGQADHDHSEPGSCEVLSGGDAHAE